MSEIVGDGDDAAAKPVKRDDLQGVSAPGAQLALLRQSRGWSIEEVASQLNLAPRQIQAIEAENYSALPGMASVRGFIRGYAKILKVDAAPLLATLAKESPPLPDPIPVRRMIATPFSESRLPTVGSASLLSRLILTVLILCLLVGGVFALQKGGLIPPFQNYFSSIVSGSIQSTDTGTTSVRSIPPDATDAASASLTIPKLETRAEALSAPASVSGNTAVTGSPVVAASPNALVLGVREDSWIEVVRANNTALISRLVRAGTTETIEINEPVSVTVGNASGVDASWRGTPLDFKAAAKNNVARLNLK